MKKLSLQDMAYKSELHSRFVAVSEDLGRELTDEEIYENALYYIETLPYSGYDKRFTDKAIRQMKNIICKYESKRR